MVYGWKLLQIKKGRGGGLKEMETLQESHYCYAYSVYVKSSDKEH